MKKLAAGVFCSLFLIACSEENVFKRNRIMNYDECSNDFTLSFEERTTITEKDSTTEITVSVKSKAFTKDLKMQQVRAASGVKYATKDGSYIYWEHQGEILFGTEDSTYCLCK